ncbi:MAG: TIGR02281 family clan AA aspartic protease [Sphingopyxis sp.]
MDSSNGPALIWGTIVIMSVIGSLAARQLRWGQVARYTLAWVAIFAVVYGLFLFSAELKQLWARVTSDLSGTATVTRSGETTIVHRNGDGHFWAQASVNGRTAQFLIDSGATTSTISADTADTLGLSDRRAAMPMVVETANGLANSWPLGDVSVTVGSITTANVALHMSDHRDSTNLLGMNWLNQLGSWQVRGDEMILTPVR